MASKDNRKLNIVFAVVFMMAFVAALVCIPKLARHTEKSVITDTDDGVCVVLMGDSNVAISRFEGEVEDRIESKTGYKVYNAAMGGSCAARIEDNNDQDKLYDKCSLYNLVNLVVTGNKQLYLENMDILNKPYWWATDKIDLLADIEFENVDYIVMTYGTNDYFAGVRSGVDTESDGSIRYDQLTYKGAISSSIDKIHKKYPNIKIILTTTTYCYVIDGQENVPATEYDCGGGTLLDYHRALNQIADARDYVYVVDMYNLVGLDESNYYENMCDNIHMWIEPQQRFCDILSEEIMSIESEK